MPQLKHPLSGALYTLRPDGLVAVENNDLRGVRNDAIGEIIGNHEMGFHHT